jgi:hypothetical protein
MKPIAAGVLLIATISLFSSCNLGGYQEIGKQIDPYDPLGVNSKTYMRAVSDVSMRTTEMITYSLPDPGNKGELVLTTIVDDGSEKAITITRARYTLSGTDITLVPFVQYKNEYGPGLHNATQTTSNFNPDIAGTKFFEIAGNLLTYGVDPNKNQYTDLQAVFANVMTKLAPDRARMILKLVELTMMTAQSRLEGFGGMGMVEYLGKTVTLRGMRKGSYDLYSVGGLGSPNTTDFTYKDYSDHSSLTIEGLQRVVASQAGDGSMSRTVSFTIEGSSQTWTGSIKYDNITITSSVPSAGYYEVTVEGQESDVPSTAAIPGHFDLAEVMP